MMLKAIITIGVSGSGKTTWAEQVCREDRTYVNINRDDLRFSLTGTKGWGEYRFNKSIESLVTHIQREAIKQAYSQSKNVIVSDTNLNLGRREGLTLFLKSLGYCVELKDFHVDFFTACKRDAQRSGGVGYDVINCQWKHYLEHINFDSYSPSTAKPLAYIFDIDGTLAKMGSRSPYDWDKVGEDSINFPVTKVLGSLSRSTKIILLSGRDSCCRGLTEGWLDKWEISYDNLLMRNEGDNRKDTIVKLELFNKIKEDYFILGVFDDRPCMYRLWKDLGLTVFMVGDAYSEF